MARLIKVDGSEFEVAPMSKHFSLQELYGYLCPGDDHPIVEARWIDDDRLIWCHEEGKLRDLPYNPVANQEYGKHIPGDFFVGPVLVTHVREVEP